MHKGILNDSKNKRTEKNTHEDASVFSTFSLCTTAPLAIMSGISTASHGANCHRRRKEEEEGGGGGGGGGIQKRKEEEEKKKRERNREREGGRERERERKRVWLFSVLRTRAGGKKREQYVP